MAALSLLSALSSSITSLSHSSSTTTTKHSRFPGNIRCSSSKIEGNSGFDDEGGFRRRDLFNCLALSAGLEVISSSGSFSGNAYAADLIERRQRSEFLSAVKDVLYTTIKANPDLIPSIQTLALNDALTYDKATKTGGPNGSIRFSSEITRPENEGLSAALNLIEEVKKKIDSDSKGGPISYADLIQHAAQTATKATFLASAIRKCGGNEEKGGILYNAYGSSGQWALFDKNLGRTDAQEPDPEGRVPKWDKASLAVMSAFLGPDQAATEEKLATDPDVAPWVQKYQRSRETVSQTDYEVIKTVNC
ncbi:hypothetical protein KSS87_000338 [Heliosperma pusillum]|nr:hypothetical protein KSS87_000338 [Heliosperma pusillum]